MGGWFRDELNSERELSGLRYCLAGLGAEVFRQLDVAVVLLPAADIVQALRLGAINAFQTLRAVLAAGLRSELLDTDRDCVALLESVLPDRPPDGRR